MCVTLALWFQVMENGIRELADCYEGDVYDGHGVRVHEVPNDTDTLGYDKYPEGRYATENKLFSKPEKLKKDLKRESQAILSHCSSSLYRAEFKRCAVSGCDLCRDHRERACPLMDFFRSFPNDQVPAPVPTWPPFSIDRKVFKQNAELGVDVNGALESLLVPVKPNPAAAPRALRLRYRTFGDLLESRLPRNSPVYTADFYRGKTRRFTCTDCREPKVFRSEAVVKRHKIIVHSSGKDGSNPSASVDVVPLNPDT